MPSTQAGQTNAGTSDGANTVRRDELIADGIVHAVGLVGAIAGGVTLWLLLNRRGETEAQAPVLVYISAMIAMLAFSGLYNMARAEGWRNIFRRFDHAGIFAMIAGTYTPFTVLRLDGAWSWGLTAFVWTVAGIGIAIKIWKPERFYWFFLAIYLLLGWVGLVAIGPLVEALTPSTLVLLGLGGLVYSAGVVFHLRERMRFNKAIWHSFVVAAAAIHFAAVLHETLSM
ncbi:hemolysin III [Faunimonas pinastri]|uniref:Hemolysin III n=1 Tax=Faunimonas pinastri TaxID=1855383 RepID=A0A1H9APX3_9HYPH|nr:hemolysin III family protein [Faunimonas pinastri]SEP78517.1 hemolysin III [Faunimonas pinastri]